MSSEILKLIIPLLLIGAGIWAKYSSEPLAKKYWWILVVLGTINLIFKLIQLF